MKHEPVIRNRYCHFAKGAESGICPTAQDRKPLITELMAANATALRGGCSDFL